MSVAKTTDWWGELQIAIADAQAGDGLAKVDWEHLAAAIAECEELRAERRRLEEELERLKAKAPAPPKDLWSPAGLKRVEENWLRGDAEADKRIDELMAKQPASDERRPLKAEAGPFEVSIDEEEAGLLCVNTPRGCIPFLTWEEFHSLESNLRAWANANGHRYMVRHGLLSRKGKLLPFGEGEERGKALEAMQKAERARLER